MHSKLVTYTNLTNNCTAPRNHELDTLTPHVVVGQVTAQWVADYFTDPKLEASSNYGIGRDGDISLCVEEENRSWCTSSWENDHRAITVEIASDSTDPYAITDKAYAALIDLFTDICLRHGKTKVIWKPDKEYMLNYNPAPNEMRITVHRWFANKSCPGPYLYDRLVYVAEEINRRLGDSTTTTASQAEQKLYRVRKAWFDAETQKGAFIVLDNAINFCKEVGDGYKVYDWEGTEVYAPALEQTETAAVKPLSTNLPETKISTKGLGYLIIVILNSIKKIIKNLFDK